MEEPKNVAYPQAIFIPHTAMFEDIQNMQNIHSSPYIIFLLPSFQTFQVKDEENCSLSIPATPPFSPYYEESSSTNTPLPTPPSSPTTTITPIPTASPKKQRHSRSKSTINSDNVREISVRVPHHRSFIDFKFYADNNSIYFTDYAASLLLDVNQSTLRGHICQLAKRYPSWRLSGKAVGLSCNLNNMAMLNQAIREWPKEGPLFHINLANTKHFLNASRIPYEDRGTYVVMKPYPIDDTNSPSSKNKRKRDEGEPSGEHESQTTTTSTEKTQMDSIDEEGESTNSEIDDL